jgi:hypothetical protein
VSLPFGAGLEALEHLVRQALIQKIQKVQRFKSSNVKPHRRGLGSNLINIVAYPRCA